MNAPLPNHHADPIGVGAPADEIEITPAMLDAGVSVLCEFETETTDESYWARRVYSAMRSAAGSGETTCPDGALDHGTCRK
jgi:hypothetical protein